MGYLPAKIKQFSTASCFGRRPERSTMTSYAAYIDLGSCSHRSALKHLTFAYLFVGVSLGPAQICMYNLGTKLNICDMMLWMYAPWPAQAKACIQPISHHTIPPHIRPCSTLYVYIYIYLTFIAFAKSRLSPYPLNIRVDLYVLEPKDFGAPLELWLRPMSISTPKK